MVDYYDFIYTINDKYPDYDIESKPNNIFHKSCMEFFNKKRYLTKRQLEELENTCNRDDDEDFYYDLKERVKFLEKELSRIYSKIDND